MNNLSNEFMVTEGIFMEMNKHSAIKHKNRGNHISMELL